MGAAVASTLKRPLADLDAGTVGYNALGVAGVVAVLLAGWTTANPMLYRAGLAFQVITPAWPRWLVTLIAGVVTTITACSPFVFTKMLDFVGIYGLLLMPVGTIVVLEHWVFPRIGLTLSWTARKGLLLNWPALVAWLGIAGDRLHRVVVRHHPTLVLRLHSGVVSGGRDLSLVGAAGRRSRFVAGRW